MCSFLVDKGNGSIEYIKYRGEEKNVFTKNELRFIHYLLSITGEKTTQPFIDGEIVCLYNGEIYNQPYEKTDGEVIIPLYKKYGLLFPKELDGEFAIALYDFKSDLALFITDRFGTKPLWRNGIQCASYESGVGGRQIEPNTIEGVRISDEKELFRHKYHQWDWNQYKTTYNDWILAFEEAVKKRATDRCFIGLSSGYDSGAISWALQGINYKAFSILNNENSDIIKKRAKYVYEFEELKPDFDRVKQVLNEKMENVKYQKAKEKLVKDDTASVGLAAICERANREGRKVCLSGQGADEIIGDYALYPKQSNFKGQFPERLKEWDNFSKGLQRDYLTKEEYVGGAFSIETRYPFLDTKVVQEFLWLAPALKNRVYKAPIAEYLERNNVPYDKNIKKGFRPY